MPSTCAARGVTRRRATSGGCGYYPRSSTTGFVNRRHVVQRVDLSVMLGPDLIERTPGQEADSANWRAGRSHASGRSRLMGPAGRSPDKNGPRNMWNLTCHGNRPGRRSIYELSTWRPLHGHGLGPACPMCHSLPLPLSLTGRSPEFVHGEAEGVRGSFHTPGRTCRRCM